MRRNRRRRSLTRLGWFVVGLQLAISPSQLAASCANCHKPIEDIAVGEMAERIVRLGSRHGDASGCIVCHGGDPTAQDVSSAHLGAPLQLSAAGGPEGFYADPGDSASVGRTCGQCHEGYAERWRKSVMSTGAVSIERGQCRPARDKRVRLGDATRRFGRYPVADQDGPEPATGTASYKRLVLSLGAKRPELFAERLHAVPVAPLAWSAQDSPAYCRTCHGVPAAPRDGSSCSSCHMAYGPYQGLDPTIARSQRNTIAFHRIQAGGPSRITHPDGREEVLPGIALKTCFQCHFDPRLAGTNAIGDAHVHYGREHDGSGSHLLCQDCHTSLEMHGDGNIPVAAGAQVEVRCEDCHGTTEYFPWELPLQFGDSDEPVVVAPGARGFSSDAGDGPGSDASDHSSLLLTSKGNPFGNVRRVGDEVLLYSAAGGVHKVTLLKSLAAKRSWRSELSRQVKSSADHRDMACSECHADWLPPCLGCHDGSRHSELDPSPIPLRSHRPAFGD